MKTEMFTTEELRSIYAMAADKAAAVLRQNRNTPNDKYYYYIEIHRKAYNEVIKRNFAE